MTEEAADPGLSDLLNELSKAEGNIPASKPEEVKTAEIISETKSEPEPIVQTEPVSAPASMGELDKFLEDKPEVVTRSFVEAELAKEDVDAQAQNELKKKLLDLINTAVDESKAFNKEMEVDRKKCDDVYNLLAPKIQSGTYSGSDAVALVQILQVKSDISANRSRHMDSIAKILVSLKSNNAVGSGDSGGGGGKTNEGPSRAEVLKLLDAPLDD